MPLLVTDPIDLLLDANGDLDFSSGGPVFSSGIDGVAQAIRIRLLMVAGEWFLNLDAGMPYYERPGIPATKAILAQKFNPGRVTRIFRDELLDTPGVKSVETLTVAFDGRTRTLSVAWTVTTDFGDSVSDSLSKGQN